MFSLFRFIGKVLLFPLVFLFSGAWTYLRIPWFRRP